MQHIAASVAAVARYFVSAPLRALFERGPSWMGGWQGRDRADICADLTGSPATFWLVHDVECDEIVEKRFQSFLVVVQISVYGYLVFTMLGLLVRACIFRWTVTLPMERVLASVGTTFHRTSDTSRLHSSPRRRIEAAPSLHKSLWTDTLRTVPAQNGPPH